MTQTAETARVLLDKIKNSSGEKKISSVMHKMGGDRTERAKVEWCMQNRLSQEHRNETSKLVGEHLVAASQPSVLLVTLGTTVW